MEKRYKVTKHFVDGLLAGITLTEKTSVKFEVGRQYGYFVVLAVEELSAA